PRARPPEMSGPRLDGKVAIVTGAGSGIGEATAKRFAEEGARLVLTDLNEEYLAKACEATGATPVAGDVSSWETAEALARTARDADDAAPAHVAGPAAGAGRGDLAGGGDAGDAARARRAAGGDRRRDPLSRLRRVVVRDGRAARRRRRLPRPLRACP